MKKSKVLLIHNVVSPHVLPVFKELHKLCHVEVWFCAERESNRNWQEKITGFPYQILPNFRWEFRGKDLFTFFINPTIWQKLSAVKVDVVIISGWDLPSYWLTALYCHLNGIPYILWSGSTQYETSWRRSLAQPITKLMVQGATAYIAYGLRARDYLIDLGADPKKVHIAYNGIAIDAYKRQQKKFAAQIRKKRQELLLTKKTVILFYGQLIERKQPQLLLSSFIKLQKKYPNVRLLLIGSGPLRPLLLQQSQAASKNSVLILDDPGDKEMPLFYHLADFLVLPSSEEVWGLVVNQAMASALPVIVSDRVGSAVDLVVPDKSGYVFQHDSGKDLRQALEAMLKNKRRKAMGRYAQREVEKTSPKRVAQQLKTALGSVIDSKPTKDDLVKFIELPTISDNCLLSFAQHPELPFPIRRVYYMYQNTPGLARGFHAHKKIWQAIFCLQGSFRLVLDDGQKRRDVWLNQAHRGILLEPMVWHEMQDISPDCIMLVFASESYQPKDYIRNYYEFIATRKRYANSL